MKMKMKSIKLFSLWQLIIFLTLFVSKDFFINFEVAFLSSVLILQGSMYSYSKLVKQRLESGAFNDEDALKKIDDPYDLYDEDQEEIVDDENFDLKAYIKEEKKRIKKGGALKSTLKTSPALVSIFRLVPYLFLVIGFLSLNNHHILLLKPYLSGLGVGIIAGYFIGKSIFSNKK